MFSLLCALSWCCRVESTPPPSPVELVLVEFVAPLPVHLPVVPFVFETSVTVSHVLMLAFSLVCLAADYFVCCLVCLFFSFARMLAFESKYIYLRCLGIRAT